ncbi:hypothetical protein KDA08_05640, partial [Candidatus Saccharibacteria bacterium]|nr:hypothetical protein [Candidatus Saccharibacteria bacterium]
ESIIKQEPIVGPKIPESFNVLVKELQGLGLKVDLINQEGKEVDAEDLLEATIAEEAENLPEIVAESTTPMDVTEEMVASEFEVLDDTGASDISVDDTVAIDDNDNENNVKEEA